MPTEPIDLDIAMSVDPTVLASIAEFSRTMGGIVDVFAAASRAMRDWGRSLEAWHDNQRPNAVPLIASPWRQRYERRHYGRVLTRDERDTRWRLMWGGLA